MVADDLNRCDALSGWFGVFIYGAGEGKGRVRVDAHWLLSGVIRNSLNGSEVLVNHVAFAGLIRFKLRAA